MLAIVREDLADLDHDRTAKPGELRKFKDCETTCDVRGFFDWDEERLHSPSCCPRCVKKTDIAPETKRVLELSDMVDAGITFDVEDLPHEIIAALAYARRYRSAQVGVMGALLG